MSAHTLPRGSQQYTTINHCLQHAKRFIFLLSLDNNLCTTVHFRPRPLSRVPMQRVVLLPRHVYVDLFYLLCINYLFKFTLKYYIIPLYVCISPPISPLPNISPNIPPNIIINHHSPVLATTPHSSPLSNISITPSCKQIP